MCRRQIISGILLILIPLATHLKSQTPEMSYHAKEEAPNFYYEIMTVASQDTGKTTLQFFSKIAYDELVFLKEGNRFRAQYELSVTVFDNQGNQADGQILHKDIWVDTYPETNSRTRFSVASVEFDLKPAVYELYAGIMDLESRKTGRRKTKVTIPHYRIAPIEVSDIVMVDFIKPDSSSAPFAVPKVSDEYNMQQESIYLWFELYNYIGLDSIRVEYKILNKKNETVRDITNYRKLNDKRTKMVIQIPREGLVPGQYQLSVLVGEGANMVKRNRDISVHWMGMPTSTGDIDEAIDQLQYIADGKELKAMKNAVGEEKKHLFREFWKSRDPSPGTEENEVMDEYYRRVDYANETFGGGTFQRGWRSDRGMVYIILGAPNDIERYPFEINSKPYEIWSYYQYNRQFIFVDQTGFGDYRLISPFWGTLNEFR